MRTRSPFPGMDPWLEGYWSSVHHRLISDFAAQIKDQLPEDLFVDIEVTVYVTDDGKNSGTAIPDTGIFKPLSHRQNARKPSTASSTAVATPYRIKLLREPVELGHVVIRSLKKREPLVTAVEVFSPTNKVDRRGRKAYAVKREAYYRAGVNLVEVDLIRAGLDLIDVPFEELPEGLLTPYKAVVHRAIPIEETEAEYYSLPLCDPLSAIYIPLRAADEDVVLNLQEAINRVYDGGSYGTRIDYQEPVEPPLSPEDTAWAADVISKST
jgi:Protein of unknown function (DUF4058)